MLLLDETFIIEATRLVACATKRIDISTFKAEISPKPLGRPLNLFFQTLYKKRAEGIQINFLLNWNLGAKATPRANLKALNLLQKNGIHPRILPNNRCCHAKIIIIDEKIAIIGSHNLSIRATTANFETSLLTDHEPTIKTLQYAFNQNLALSHPAH